MTTPAQQAALAALEELLAAGIPERHATALSRAMHLGEAVIDIVDERYRARAANPKAWAAFHRIRLSQLPWWRWAARRRHRRLFEHYQAMVEAGTAIPCGGTDG